MAALRSRLSLNSIRNGGNVVRRSLNTQSSSAKSFLIPVLVGSAATAVVGGSAAYFYNNMKDAKFNFLPAVHASAPVVSSPAERTFIMIKPDGVKRGLISDIIKRFEQRGYKLVAMKMVQPDADLLNEHYGDLKGKPFFPSLIKHVSSAPVVAMVWEGNNVVKQGRQMLGETDPKKSLPGSIRGDYSIDMGRNIIHGSDSVESADAEIKLWFIKSELMNYQLPVHSMVFE